MTELVLAVFDAASAAGAAAHDLEVARIPSAVIRREVSDRNPKRPDSARAARPSVIVAVDEMHALAVTGILNQHGPLEVEARVAQSHRR